jgi:hypothetical protein
MSSKKLILILKIGVGVECVLLTKYAWDLYKSGVGVNLNLPYCNNMIFPYWFMIVVGIAPISAQIYKAMKKLHKKTINKDTTDLSKLWSKHYGN